MDSKGLSAVQCDANRERYGANVLPQPKRPPLPLQYAAHLFNLFSLMFFFVAAVSLVLFILRPQQSVNAYLAGIFVLVALLNAAIEFYQEYSSALILASFQASVTPPTRV